MNDTLLVLQKVFFLKLEKTLSSEKPLAEVVKIMYDSRISFMLHSMVKIKKSRVV